jgi:hypothetical protein
MRTLPGWVAASTHSPDAGQATARTGSTAASLRKIPVIMIRRFLSGDKGEFLEVHCVVTLAGHLRKGPRERAVRARGKPNLIARLDSFLYLQISVLVRRELMRTGQ